MDIQTRKLNLIEDVLNIESDETLTQLEELLAGLKQDLKNPFTKEELGARIDKSMQDSIADRVTSSKDLLKEIKTWG